MSSHLCFICHNIVEIDTNEEVRDKYRELIGINLCSDAFLCNLCTHMLNKFWDFKSVCLKRSLEYPVLFSEKGTLNLLITEVEINAICNENICNRNNKIIHFVDKNDNLNYDYGIFNECVDLPDVKNEYINNDIDIINEYQNNDVDIINEHQNNEVDTKNEFDEKINIINTELVDNNENNSNDNDGDDDNNYELFNESYDVNEEDNNKNTNNDHNIEVETNINEKQLTDDLQDDEKKEKSKKCKSKKKKGEFDKIVLSLEEQKADLERNRKEKKYIEAEFKCYNCALGFLFKDTYQAHMMRHEESNGEYRCDTCTLRFATPAVLRSHVALHAERHICRRCKATLRPRARASHAAQCYNKPGDVAACHKCPRLFKDSSGLQQHLKRFHQTKTSTRTYSCSVCGKTYSNQAAVRTHMIKHIHRKFSCEVCQATFSSPYTLTQHKRKHTSSADTQYCAVCDKSFRDRKSYAAHRRNAKHHQEESFECPICSRACANQRSLNYHIEAVHSTSKNYVCARCPARYSTEKALRRHVRGHEGKRETGRAVCHLCGRGFKGNNKLNRHLREVCEKEKLEEELASYYAQEDV